MTKKEIINILKLRGAHITELISDGETTYYLCFNFAASWADEITKEDFESVKDLLEYNETKHVEIPDIMVRNEYYLDKKCLGGEL